MAGGFLLYNFAIIFYTAMKTFNLNLFIIAFLWVFFSIDTRSQNYTRERDFVIAPMTGIGGIVPSKVALVSGTAAARAAWIASYRGELISKDGTVQQHTYYTGLWGLETYYRWKDRRSSNRWSVGLSTAWHQQVFKLDHPFSFSYKGYDISATVWNVNYVRTGLMLRRTWMKEWAGTYIQLGGYYSTLFYDQSTSGPRGLKAWEDEFIEQGNGDRTKAYNIQKGVIHVVPEIGMQYGENRGIELSISYYHPLQNLFQMETSFVKSNQVMGVNRMDVSLGVVMANIKLPITVVKRRQTITSETKVYEPEPVKEPKPKKIKEPKPKKVKEPKPNKEPKPKKPKEPKPEKPAEKAAPDPKPAVPSRYDAAVVNQPLVIDNIYFELTKSDLLESSYKELEQVAEWMQANPIVEIRLEGHTDKIGDSEKNLMLSRERVNAVREYLIRKGINSARIATKGYGDTRLVCKPSPCEKNRRVELVVTKK